jgi:hypothetical protein
MGIIYNQGCCSNETNADWLDIPYESLQEYFNYVDNRGEPSVLIIGAGRGATRYNSHYAREVYGEKAKDYFLLDFKEKLLPDVVGDILNLSELSQIASEQFHLIIFEHIPVCCSFSYKAINDALDLLKPGGAIVSNTSLSRPRFVQKWDIEKIIKEDKSIGEKSYRIQNDITFFYSQDPTRVCNFSRFTGSNNSAIPFNRSFIVAADKDIPEEAMLYILNSCGLDIIRSMFEYNHSITDFTSKIKSVKFSQFCNLPKKLQVGNFKRMESIMVITKTT